LVIVSDSALPINTAFSCASKLFSAIISRHYQPPLLVKLSLGFCVLVLDFEYELNYEPICAHLNKT